MAEIVRQDPEEADFQLKRGYYPQPMTAMKCLICYFRNWLKMDRNCLHSASYRQVSVQAYQVFGRLHVKAKGLSDLSKDWNISVLGFYLVTHHGVHMPRADELPGEGVGMYTGSATSKPRPGHARSGGLSGQLRSIWGRKKHRERNSEKQKQKQGASARPMMIESLMGSLRMRFQRHMRLVADSRLARHSFATPLRNQRCRVCESDQSFGGWRSFDPWHSKKGSTYEICSNGRCLHNGEQRWQSEIDLFR